ncbi:hypothetical protein I3842_10G138800 [Carya illinoinensis]|uniref:Uncharacterized protein n=1 Tax=Carya illinoinensis TaxID=32201 RepID=A0A922J4G8_CARIL|nr:hypothetical protein I3842_10G138800 [Carya illinoinensis]
MIEALEALDHDLEIGTCDTKRSIYSVPKTLGEINDWKWFEPRVVSIGHYHYEQRTADKSEEELMQNIRPLEDEARDYYSEAIESQFEFESESESELGNDLFLKMLILDGCFILELFQILGKSRQTKSVLCDHPLSSMAWAIPHLYGDLLLLGNQIPFFVLEKLLETTKRHDDQDPLSLVALRFFNKVMRRKEKELIKMSNDLNDSLHLLDMVRKSFIHDLYKQPFQPKSPETVPVIYCVTKLIKAGIKIKPRKADSFLAVEFNNGVIEMPKITLDYFMQSFLVNCMAFEQFHNESSKHITVYAYFLDCIVTTAKDVDYLHERDIINSYVGKNSEVVQFINKLGMEIDVETDKFYLYNLFEKVNRRYKDKWKVYWHWYFKMPWSFISALAAVVMLVLTFLQTSYTIYAYVNPK